MAFFKRSVSLADPQGPRNRRISGALSVSENEYDLSGDSVLFVGRNKRHVSKLIEAF